MRVVEQSVASLQSRVDEEVRTREAQLQRLEARAKEEKGEEKGSLQVPPELQALTARLDELERKARVRADPEVTRADPAGALIAEELPNLLSAGIDTVVANAIVETRREARALAKTENAFATKVRKLCTDSLEDLERSLAQCAAAVDAGVQKSAVAVRVCEERTAAAETRLSARIEEVDKDANTAVLRLRVDCEQRYGTRAGAGAGVVRDSVPTPEDQLAASGSSMASSAETVFRREVERQLRRTAETQARLLTEVGRLREWQSGPGAGLVPKVELLTHEVTAVHKGAGQLVNTAVQLSRVIGVWSEPSPDTDGSEWIQASRGLAWRIERAWTGLLRSGSLPTGTSLATLTLRTSRSRDDLQREASEENLVWRRDEPRRAPSPARFADPSRSASSQRDAPVAAPTPLPMAVTGNGLPREALLPRDGMRPRPPGTEPPSGIRPVRRT